MNKLSGMLLFILSVALATVDGWGACQSVSGDYGYHGACGSSSIDYVMHCQDPITTTVCGHSCTFYSNYPQGYCSGVSVSASDCNAYAWMGHFTGFRCDTQREADSTQCFLDGNFWDSSNDTCKINHCKAADSTWLSTSIASCTGSNNYALVNTDSTCEHVGTCCPNDSIPSGNVCKWRCDSVLTTCGNRTGELFGGVLPDTSVSGQDTTFSYQCYYNCSHSPNPDSTVYLVEGNIVLSGPSDSIPDGIKSETFNSVRTTTGGVYIYDYLSPAASEYIDSIAAMKCVEHLWRCVINNKYVYWYDNQEVPAGCTNIVRVK
jgi:hypothetical protein